jgi:hypothetical protein
VCAIHLHRPLKGDNPLPELTAQLIATRRLLDQLHGLRLWNADLRYRLRLATIRAETELNVAEIDALIEVANYHEAVARVCGGAS